MTKASINPSAFNFKLIFEGIALRKRRKPDGTMVVIGPDGEEWDEKEYIKFAEEEREKAKIAEARKKVYE